MIDNPFALAIVAFLAYWIAVISLSRSGALEKRGISSFGPILMIRTRKGQNLLHRLSKPKNFWRFFASLGIPLVVISMIAMFALLLYSDYMMISQPPRPSAYTEPQNVVILPGINRFIPFTWGIIGLIIAIVAHEFSHAILGKVEGIAVKSLGILLLIIPIGAFAELDEEQLLGTKKEGKGEDRKEGEGEVEGEIKKLATRDQRLRVFASGVIGNFAVAFIALSLFFGSILNAIEPTGNNVVVLDVVKNSNAEKAGLHRDMVITALDGIKITNLSQYNSYLDSIESGSSVAVHAIYDKQERVFWLEKYEEKGVLIVDTIEGYPAREAGLTPGMKIVKLNGTPVNNAYEFLNYMNKTKPGDILNVHVLDGAEEKVFQIELASAPHQSKGFLGIRVDTSKLGMAVGEFPSQAYLQALRKLPSLLYSPYAWLWLASLPFIDTSAFGFSGFEGLLLQFYQPTAWVKEVGIDVGIFWIANILFWTGWINLTIALFNCLPAVPLDGGHVFREIARSFVSKFTNDEVKRERVSSAIVTGLALLIFSSFFFLVFGPYLIHGSL
jgi:membrane-associated protease RseP (regulator of RpoE activity)